jgi:hypothetical protein
MKTYRVIISFETDAPQQTAEDIAADMSVQLETLEETGYRVNRVEYCLQVSKSSLEEEAIQPSKRNLCKKPLEEGKNSTCKTCQRSACKGC